MDFTVDVKIPSQARLSTRRAVGGVAALAGLLILIASQLVVPVAAAATGPDNGDGNPICHSAEICYSQDNPASDYQKDYYWGGSDGADYASFHDIYTGYLGQRVLNHASSMNNRDTVCDVFVVDYTSDGRNVSTYQRFSHHASVSSWAPFTSFLNDHNDAHWRCVIGGL
jgi:hypothetical protein